jgi:biotin transport system substrate-specific component
MEIVAAIGRNRYDLFHWRYHLSLPWKLALALGMAGVTGLLAQVRFPIPWSPVPVTGQTFAVLLAGVLLGRWWGGVSMTIYAALGVLGLPWFSGWSSGLGATGGYIVGFILAALFLGHFTDRHIKSRGFLSMLGLMLVANFILIYVPGLIWLGLWLNVLSHTPTTLAAIVTMGAIPFIAGDITKAILAAAAAKAVTPKSAYDI